MSQQQFDAAHDQYLEPPDYDERPDCEDEDREFEEAKQRRIDEEDWQAETLRQKQECEQ